MVASVFETYAVFSLVTHKNIFFLIMLPGPELPRYTLHRSSDDKGIFSYSSTYRNYV